MKKLLILLFSALSLTAFAQQPNWYTDSQRAANYPKAQYFIGIAYGQVRSGESVGSAMERLKIVARVDALSTIRVHVQNETRSNMHSESLESIDDWSETIKETMDSRTTTEVDLEIPGLQVEAWSNPNKNEVVAFAYIRKSTLCRQMDKQVTAGLTRIETILENANYLVANGQKLQAKEAIKKVVPLFSEVEQAQRILIVADPLSDAEMLQLAETKQLTQRYMSMVAELKNGLNIYLSCNAGMFATNYFSLKGEIQGELSKLGSTFVSNAEQSDWAIYVTASAREYNRADFGGTTSYFVYVDAQIVIEKIATGQRIYENAISEKGGHTHNFEQAARDAYKHISPKIIAIIKEQIKQ